MKHKKIDDHQGGKGSNSGSPARDYADRKKNARKNDELAKRIRFVSTAQEAQDKFLEAAKLIKGSPERDVS